MFFLRYIQPSREAIQHVKASVADAVPAGLSNTDRIHFAETNNDKSLDKVV